MCFYVGSNNDLLDGLSKSCRPPRIIVIYLVHRYKAHGQGRSQEFCSGGASHWRYQISNFSYFAQRSLWCHWSISGLLQQSGDANSQILSLQNTCEHNQKIKFSLRFFLNNSSIISESMSHHDYSSKKNNPSDGFDQARNRLGIPGGAKSFLRGTQIFKLCTIRPVTSLGHQRWRRVFWEGPKFFQTMSNSFQQCPTGFSRGGGEKACRGGFVAPGYGPVSNSFKVCPTHFYREAENFSSWLRAW